MKKLSLLTFILFLLGNVALQAQCEPVAGLPPETVVFPEPYQEEVMAEGSGITDPACINVAYEYLVTVNTPADFNGIGITNIELDPETALDDPDTGESTLPEGLDFVCNPPDCVFPPGEPSCILISGTVSNPDEIGIFDLKISMLINTVIAGLPFTFPDETLAPGNYFLCVAPEDCSLEGDLEECNNWVVSGPSSVADQVLASKVIMTNQPNPFSSLTQIVLNSEVQDNFTMTVTNMAGEVVHTRQLALGQGVNIVELMDLY